jgi:hypothetical protein
MVYIHDLNLQLEKHLKIVQETWEEFHRDFISSLWIIFQGPMLCRFKP